MSYQEREKNQPFMAGDDMQINYKRLKNIFQEKIYEHITFLETQIENYKNEKLEERDRYLEGFDAGTISAYQTEVFLLKSLLESEQKAMQEVEERNKQCRNKYIP